MKFRLLEADEIECRVKQVKENGAAILLYKTARTDMDILDETVGPMNWVSDYKEIKGNLYAGIGIRDGETMVWKWDCGIESRDDGEGNQKKGEASDAFKRAGFKWGIGRELYTGPFIWIPKEKMNISTKEWQGKNTYSTFDTFSVDTISYDDKGKINGLAIRNDKTGKIAFVWRINTMPEPHGEAPPKTDPPKPAPKDTPPKSPQKDVMFRCSECGDVLTPFTDSKGKTASIRAIATRSEQQFGRVLCVDCASIESGKHESPDN